MENIGQPIEGFSADIYLQAFPGLLEVDFNRVKTREGAYAYADGKLGFVRTRNDVSTSAEEAISKEGHQTLFENIRGRLGVHLSVDEIINGIAAQGSGKITGTILLDQRVPSYATRPTQSVPTSRYSSDFIVQNVRVVLSSRFSTQRDGSFSVTLPAGNTTLHGWSRGDCRDNRAVW